MSTNVPPSAPSRVRRRIFLAFLATLAAGAALVWYFLAESEASAERRLAAALAEADRLDPGWRLSDLEARRAAVPDGKNAALVVFAVANLMPADWNEEKFWQLFDEIHLRPECRLEPATARALREGLAKARAAVAEARKLKDMPAGRFPCPAGQWPPFHRGHAQVRNVASLLEHAALLRIEEGDADGAVEDCRAMLNASRSFGDEPSVTALLVRGACRSMAVGQIERVLAQREPPGGAAGVAAIAPRR
jgi:hypothetical protein